MGVFEVEVLEAHMAHTVKELHERIGERRQDKLLAALGGVGHEEQLLRLAVQEPFAGGVQLGEDVHGVEASSLQPPCAAPNPVGRGEGDHVGDKVDGLHAKVGVGPVMRPVARHPKPLRCVPPLRAVADELKRAGSLEPLVHRVCEYGPPRIRPARERQRRTAGIEPRPGRHALADVRPFLHRRNEELRDVRHARPLRQRRGRRERRARNGHPAAQLHGSGPLGLVDDHALG